VELEQGTISRVQVTLQMEEFFKWNMQQRQLKNSGTAVGIKVKDGVVLGVEKLIISKMLEPGSNRRINSVDKHVGLAFAGLSADSRPLINRARLEAKNYKNSYEMPIPAKILNERMSGFLQAYTLYGHLRPFGCSILLATWDTAGPSLHMIEPSGLSFAYYGTAIGKARQAAKGEIEKLKLADMTVKQVVKEVAKIIYTIHDEVKDKEFELELSWICAESNYEHQLVPREVFADAEKYAKSSLEEDMHDDE